MVTATEIAPLVQQLIEAESKAEIVDGAIVAMPPSGGVPSYAAGRISTSLSRYEVQGGVSLSEALLYFCATYPIASRFHLTQRFI